MIAAALRIGAAEGGDWSSAHSVQWDAGHPDNESNRELTNRLTRQSYPLGIIVNRLGLRFLDEGADFRNYTYARYGKEILEQPGAIAYQIFDSRLRPLLRGEEYDMPGVSVEVAGSIGELAVRIGIDPTRLATTIDALQRVDRRRPTPRPRDQGRTASGHRPTEEQLGVAARLAAVLRLPRHVRHHVHVRRPARRPRRTSARRRRRPHPGSVRVRRDARRSLQRQLPRRLRPRRRHGLRPPRRVTGLTTSCPSRSARSGRSGRTERGIRRRRARARAPGGRRRRPRPAGRRGRNHRRSASGGSGRARPGIHQLRSPRSSIVAGTSSMRTTVASSRTASARPSPNSFPTRSSSNTNEPNTTTMMAAAAVITRAVAARPSATAVAESPVLSYSSRTLREQEHLVVHREPEHDGEQHQRHDRLDRPASMPMRSAPQPHWKMATSTP